jgi:fatty acid desaturase
LFLHGTGYAFLLNGFHEFCHLSVFKTRFFNVFFLKVFSFLGGYNPVFFWASHSDHHKYTLHTPDDTEVVLPVKISLGSFLKVALVNPVGVWGRWKSIGKLCLGKLSGERELTLFPESDPELRKRLFNWARILLVGHGLILAVSIYFELYMIPVLVTFAPFYGGWLLFLCNNAQHIGLTDNVPDFRLNSRTIILNPLFRFLYWHMNYHVEHHMYAAVPCYRLGKAHKVIEHDLPYSRNGLWETWTEIIQILKQQKTHPDYQFRAELPSPSSPVKATENAD